MTKKNRRVDYSTKEGIEIWYLLTCNNQEEQKILTILRKNLSPEAFHDIFILTYDRMRKYMGAWHMERQLLYPGNIILETNNKTNLLRELRNCREMNMQEKQLSRMDEREEALLKRLCGEKHHLEMSRGVIRKGAAQITDGPLIGMENIICKIDRHKRLASVEVIEKPDSFCHCERGIEYRYIPAGLEITEKTI